MTLPAPHATQRARITHALRGALPLFAIAVAVALALSDWPLGWRLWVDHPYIAAFVGGTSLLFIAGAVIDVHMRRREAHRWHGLGFAAAGEFAAILYDTAIAIAALTGGDDGYRLRSEVEFHLASARDRASELLRKDADSRAPQPQKERHHAGLDGSQLAVLLGDEEWRRGCSQTLRVSRSHLVEAVSRWTATFAILNDDEDFNRVARTVTIMDLITALHMSLVALRPATNDALLEQAVFANFATQWGALRDAVDAELDFWNARRRVGSRVVLPTFEPERPAAEPGPLPLVM